MNAAFIVAEYNPFHNGHAYHIAKTRDMLRPDALVCIISGHFTQRGSASISDKWSRTRMALHAGADLVLELHPVYACSSAETFARGALLTASLTGVDGWLSFGAECTDLRLLSELAHILNAEPEPYKLLLYASLDGGKSYAAARQSALIGYCFGKNAGPAPGVTRKQFTDILNAPNNILAIEYLRAIDALHLQYAPYAVPIAATTAEPGNAQGQAGEPTLRYCSASAIRDIIRTRQADAEDAARFDTIDALKTTMPDYSRALLAAEFSMGRGPVLDEMFFPLITAIIKRGGAASLRRYRDVGEGLENRLYRAALKAGAYSELIAASATKRYPMSRIRRIFTRILLGHDEETLGAIDADSGPPYIRVLGFNSIGRGLLARVGQKAPFITNFKKLARSDPRSRAFMDLESGATDLYVTAFQNPGFHAPGQDFIRRPVRF
ncbi:MAG: nucleotidyltransferase family protein [Oscillospiraceae bacterium]|nr:nucleotidyltransferase family protein [Oscillospiraceae bacterium]